MKDFDEALAEILAAIPGLFAEKNTTKAPRWLQIGLSDFCSKEESGCQ